jgi:hypothetical protein
LAGLCAATIDVHAARATQAILIGFNVNQGSLNNQPAFVNLRRSV